MVLASSKMGKKVTMSSSNISASLPTEIELHGCLLLTHCLVQSLSKILNVFSLKYQFFSIADYHNQGLFTDKSTFQQMLIIKLTFWGLTGIPCPDAKQTSSSYAICNSEWTKPDPISGDFHGSFATVTHGIGGVASSNYFCNPPPQT